MNIFDVMEARQSREADRLMGEVALVQTTTTKPNTRSSPDPQRADFTCRAIFDVAAPKKPYDIGLKVKINAKEASCSIDFRNMPATIKRGDLITRLKTGVIYRVHRIAPDGEGRATYSLNVHSSPHDE